MEKQLEILLKSKLHDYELGTVNIDYENKQVRINVVSPQGQPKTIAVDRVSMCNVSLTEKWGKGKFIAATDVVESGECNIVEITLNSGDEITIRVER